jgi:hypothetical protein
MNPRRIISGLFILAVAGTAQQPATPPTAQNVEPPRRLPSGIRLDDLSIYSEGDFLRSPRTELPGPQQLWLFTSGASGVVSVRFGRRTEFSSVYRGGYSYNQRYSTLNGANHSISVELRTDPARHTVFAIGATGESGLVSDALFDPSYTLSVARQSQTVDQLARGLSANNPAAVIDSAVEVALSGGRRRSGEAHASISHAYSPRVSSQATVSVVREIHTYSREQQATQGYPNVTMGMADFTLTYLLSRRTSLAGSAGYARSYARQYRSEWESSSLGLHRELGRRSFGTLQGGYVRIADRQASGFGRSSYTLGGSYGTTTGRHTVAWTFRRSGGDIHGIGSQATVGVDGAWSWFSPTSAWRLGSSVGYERVNGATLGLLQAWLSQATVARRLSAHFELNMTAIYVDHFSGNLERLTRAGLRISLVWRPEPEARR